MNRFTGAEHPAYSLCQRAWRSSPGSMHNPALVKKSRRITIFFCCLCTPLVLELLEGTSTDNTISVGPPLATIPDSRANQVETRGMAPQSGPRFGRCNSDSGFSVRGGCRAKTQNENARSPGRARVGVSNVQNGRTPEGREEPPPRLSLIDPSQEETKNVKSGEFCQRCVFVGALLACYIPARPAKGGAIRSRPPFGHDLGTALRFGQ